MHFKFTPNLPLITGANGQLGRALSHLLPEAHALGRAVLDLNDVATLKATLAAYQPSILYNAAAYTAVDAAESDPETARRINTEAPQIMAEYCQQAGIPLIHVSTDYVFDGSGDTPWQESDATAPLNIYGQTKREGELRVMESGAEAMIFRTSWVYDRQGKNFLTTMLRLGREREVLSVVSDQIGRPTYAPHLAAALVEAAKHPQTGIYHLSGSGDFTSWHGFATAIFSAYQGSDLQVKQVRPQLTKDYPTPAQRPLNSRLDCHKAQEILGITLPDWRAALGL